MAAYNCALRIGCSAGNQRPSDPITRTYDQLSSSFLPLMGSLPAVENISMDIPKTIKETTVKLVDAFVDFAFEFSDLPLLPSQSNFAPVEEIGEKVKVKNIQGEIPVDFREGVYIRNGANPVFGGRKRTNSVFGKAWQIITDGEGMLHALYFSKDEEDGNWNTFYNNKQVETHTFNLEKQRNKPAFLPASQGDPRALLAAYLLNSLRFGELDKQSSSAHVFVHSGKLYSIGERHMPQQINIHTLETLGNWDLTKFWNRPFTSHPQKAPGTRELVTFGFDTKKPYVELGVISADGGEIIHRADIGLNRPVYCHQMGVTERYNVILDLPLTINMDRLTQGGPLMRYDEKAYAKIGVMPRCGDANSIMWFEVKPSHAVHILNCFEDGHEVVVRACRSTKSIYSGPGDSGLSKSEWYSRGLAKDGKLFTVVYEWRLNMQTGESLERDLTTTDSPVEVPIINPNFNGLRNKFGYAHIIDPKASSTAEILKFGGLVKFNFEKHFLDEEVQEEFVEAEYHKLPENTFCSGSSFVPKPGGHEEDDGWVVSFVHDENSNVSQVYIIDTKNFSGEAMAKITLPSRVPYGSHGIFLPMSSI